MKLIDELEGYISGQFNWIKTFLSLVKLEAKLAGLTVIPLLINLFMLFIVLITLWLGIMLLLGYGFLVILNHNYWLSITFIILLNVITLGCLLKYLAFNVKAMSFEKTRNYFHQTETEQEKLESIASSTNK